MSVGVGRTVGYQLFFYRYEDHTGFRTSESIHEGKKVKSNALEYDDDNRIEKVTETTTGSTLVRHHDAVNNCDRVEKHVGTDIAINTFGFDANNRQNQEAFYENGELKSNSLIMPNALGLPAEIKTDTSIKDEKDHNIDIHDQYIHSYKNIHGPKPVAVHAQPKLKKETTASEVNLTYDGQGNDNAIVNVGPILTDEVEDRYVEATSDGVI